MKRGPERVTIVEVGPRDGLQNEATPIATATKLELIARLRAAGLPVIEVTAFVSPKWVQQMADHAELLATLMRDADAAAPRYPVLVPNLKGLDAALAAGAREIAVFTAASESFCRKNINCSIQESLERFAPVIERAFRKGKPAAVVSFLEGTWPRRITVGNQSYGYPGDANATEPFRVERAGDGWRVGWSAPHGGRQTTWLPDSLR